MNDADLRKLAQLLISLHGYDDAAEKIHHMFRSGKCRQVTRQKLVQIMREEEKRKEAKT